MRKEKQTHTYTSSMIRIRLNGMMATESREVYASEKRKRNAQQSNHMKRMLNMKRKQWFPVNPSLHSHMHYTLCAQTKVLLSTWFYIFIILLLVWRFILLFWFRVSKREKKSVRVNTRIYRVQLKKKNIFPAKHHRHHLLLMCIVCIPHFGCHICNLDK